jgi:hypothetical protein
VLVLRERHSQRAGEPIATKAIGATGTVDLHVRSAGNPRQKLRRTGRATVRLRVTYKPKFSDRYTRSKRVTLIKGHHRK